MQINEKEAIWKITESVRAADKVLVGIGTGMEVHWPKPDMNYDSFESCVKCHQYISDMQSELPQDAAYRHLKKLLEGKDYAIISLTMDDAIFRVFDRKDKIVCPCGGLRMLQCENACTPQLYIYEEGEKQPVCPNCGGRMVFNHYGMEHYIEEGYLPSFAAYKKWLQTTINRRLCILEFDASMLHPGVIRFAFDKIAYYNQKCEFYRINEMLYQHTAENRERGISVACSGLQLLQSGTWETI